MTGSTYQRLREAVCASGRVAPAERDAVLRTRSARTTRNCAPEVLSLLDRDERDAPDSFLNSPPVAVNLSTEGCRRRSDRGITALIRLIGAGGMGLVYEAEQQHPRRLVALKLIRPFLAGPEQLRRFEHETQVLARLDHPGIARIFEAGTIDRGGVAQPFFAMELIRGRSARPSTLPTPSPDARGGWSFW